MIWALHLTTSSWQSTKWKGPAGNRAFEGVTTKCARNPPFVDRGFVRFNHIRTAAVGDARRPRAVRPRVPTSASVVGERCRDARRARLLETDGRGDCASMFVSVVGTRRRGGCWSVISSGLDGRCGRRRACGMFSSPAHVEPCAVAAEQLMWAVRSAKVDAELTAGLTPSHSSASPGTTVKKP